MDEVGRELTQKTIMCDHLHSSGSRLLWVGTQRTIESFQGLRGQRYTDLWGSSRGKKITRPQSALLVRQWQKYKRCHLNNDKNAELRRSTPLIPHAREYGEFLMGNQMCSSEVGPDRQ